MRKVLFLDGHLQRKKCRVEKTHKCAKLVAWISKHIDSFQSRSARINMQWATVDTHQDPQLTVVNSCMYENWVSPLLRKNMCVDKSGVRSLELESSWCYVQIGETEKNCLPKSI